MDENLLAYKGYHGSAEYSAQDKCFHGKVLGIRSLVTYEADNVDGLERAFAESVDEYLDLCKRHGITPEKSFSGTFQVRVSPEIHQKLAACADSTKKKLNTVVAEALEEYVVRKG